MRSGEHALHPTGGHPTWQADPERADRTLDIHPTEVLERYFGVTQRNEDATPPRGDACDAPRNVREGLNNEL